MTSDDELDEVRVVDSSSSETFTAASDAEPPSLPPVLGAAAAAPPPGCDKPFVVSFAPSAAEAGRAVVTGATAVATVTAVRSVAAPLRRAFTQPDVAGVMAAAVAKVHALSTEVYTEGRSCPPPLFRGSLRSDTDPGTPRGVVLSTPTVAPVRHLPVASSGGDALGTTRGRLEFERQRLVRFLRGIYCERDPGYTEQRRRWLEKRHSRHPIAVSSAAGDATVTGPRSAPASHVAMSPTAGLERGLMLGDAGLPRQGSDLLADMDMPAGQDRRHRRKPRQHLRVHNTRTWQLVQDKVQPMFVTMSWVPVVGCSYIQTFETKAEKAERHKMEKKRRDQDALGLLSPVGPGDTSMSAVWGGGEKRFNTLQSIKRTLTTKARDARGRRKQQSHFYGDLLNPKRQVRSPSGYTPRAGSKGDLTPSAVVALTPDDDLADIRVGVDDDPPSDGRDMSVVSQLGSSNADAPPSEADADFDGKIETLERLEDEEEYDPFLLDDPGIKSEKRRKRLNLPSLRTTIIPFSKRKDLKKDVNQQFLLMHPWVEVQGLTLTGIRKAKLIMINLALSDQPCVQAPTVAYAVVYFEKLILKKVVTKANRKLVAAVCVVLAYKFWEASVGERERDEMKKLLDQLEESFDVERKRVLRAEFELYVRLEFEMLVPSKYALPHFRRLLALYSITENEYLQSKVGHTWGLRLHEEGTAPVVRDMAVG